MRINIYAGPGSGKSTKAARLFSDLKLLHLPVEQVTEVAKEWVAIGRDITDYDQVVVFSEQMERELRYLRRGWDVVTDSPLLQQVAYMRRDGCKFEGSLGDLCRFFENDFPSINIFLDRSDIPYNETARWQNLEQAKHLDALILSVLKDYDISYRTYKTSDHEAILDYVAGSLR